ncbi:hypothetical protein KKE45_04090 [Patescibacteria group bacterium]|nr:hypothetical protein [Patescibacteria group bacterium]
MKRQKGQVALVVLVLMAVSLSLGLSISSEVVTETKIDKDEELLKQAFNAAESGIEFYLGTGKTDYVAIDGQSVADISIDDIGGSGETVLDFDEYTISGDMVNYWLTGHEEDGSLDYDNGLGGNFVGNSLSICLNDNFISTLKVDYFYCTYSSGIVSDYGVERWIYQLGSDGGVVNGATIVGDNGNCGTDRTGLTIDFSGLGNTPLLLSVTPLFNSARISLNGGGFSFPSQGIMISSVGKAGSVEAVAEAVNRRVSVSRRWGAGIADFMIDGLVAEDNISSE